MKISVIVLKNGGPKLVLTLFESFESFLFKSGFPCNLSRFSVYLIVVPKVIEFF